MLALRVMQAQPAYLVFTAICVRLFAFGTFVCEHHGSSCSSSLLSMDNHYVAQNKDLSLT